MTWGAQEKSNNFSPSNVLSLAGALTLPNHPEQYTWIICLDRRLDGQYYCRCLCQNGVNNILIRISDCALVDTNKTVEVVEGNNCTDADGVTHEVTDGGGEEDAPIWG